MGVGGTPFNLIRTRSINFDPEIGVADMQVPTLSADVSARAFVAAVIDTPVRETWGLEIQPSGYSGTAIVEYDWGEEEPLENIPADVAENTHENVRRSAAAQQQLIGFFSTGTIVNHCDGACDPD